ncbi:UNVERIFIED_CONTAM: hypothetical protein NCL1_45867 [Trichonephila clavipes]
MREANDVVLDRALYMWFSQRRSKGDPISGLLLCEKARELKREIRISINIVDVSQEFRRSLFIQ